MEQNNFELEEMKQQLAALHNRIDQQAIISDKMIKKAIDGSVNRLQRLGAASIIVCVLALVFVELELFAFGVSKLFLAATFVFLGLNAVAAYYLKLSKADVAKDKTMLDTAKRMVRYRKDNMRQIAIGLPLAFLWCIWCVFEMGNAMGLTAPKELAFLGICALIGGIIGGCIGYFSIFRPSMQEAQSIIDQIDELNE